ncbi:type II CAAX endopeptidase family protein [Streptomyces sp. 549]|uniref:CPBP family intramembrane glutamic endopeptidase n=1 Tax=Streptomyces sp. 549 TaxID=3049076 RepID=UPI0024C3CD33|nr:type II CAAX endopeptidase family protein [Streptomyces sp. 549]MDK1472610.1 type II CAAX endopeptidase family protein [Streptomyces sp. 549]
MSIKDPSPLSAEPDPAGRAGRAGGLRGSLRRRPLTWFFVLTFTLSWAAWTPYILSENGLGVWRYSFPEVGGTTQLLGVLPGAYLGPITSALLLTGITEGRRGLRIWLGRMTRLRVSWRWYVVVLLSVPAALTLTSVALSGRGPALPSAVVLAAYLPALLVQMITTGLAEEPGWREFAMPRAQRRYGPLAATVGVGLLWGAWHLPLFLTEWGGGPNPGAGRVTAFMCTTVAFSFAMTWVFNRSGGSMPLVMLLHTSVNNFFSVAWSDMFPTLSDDYTVYSLLVACVVTAVVLLMATRGRLGYVGDAAVNGAADVDAADRDTAALPPVAEERTTG